MKIQVTADYIEFEFPSGKFLAYYEEKIQSVFDQVGYDWDARRFAKINNGNSVKYQFRTRPELHEATVLLKMMTNQYVD